MSRLIAAAALATGLAITVHGAALAQANPAEPAETQENVNSVPAPDNAANGPPAGAEEQAMPARHKTGHAVKHPKKAHHGTTGSQPTTNTN